MLNIVTVNWRDYEGRGVEYTNILFDSIRRNLDTDTAARMIVFTDAPEVKYGEGIETRPLPGNLEGWFNKLWLFSEDALPVGERVLYFDLDTLIVGPIDPLLIYAGPFGILQDFYRPLELQSSVMAWEAGSDATIAIWDAYERAGCPQPDGWAQGDQSFIEKCLVRGRERLQVAFPDLFCSYKVSGGALPTKASVVVFHGRPRPHEVTTGWVPKVWCIGGISHGELKAISNTAIDKTLDNVKKACRRNLPWFAPADEHDGHVAILGGGPSLVDKIDEIRWRQSVGQHVWVLNNAHKALKDVKYDAQVLLDARPETAGFVCEASQYLVASQCDPSVFSRLWDKDVTLWHTNSTWTAEFLKDEKERAAYLVGGGTTVGMNALALAFLLGYRQIHLYGFDSSYRDGTHHAYPQSLNDGEHVSEAVYGDKTYQCANWMVGQARDFQEVVPGYMDDGLVVTVHGTGLLPDIGLSMLGMRSAAQQRADAVLQRMPPGARGVEVGVFAGQMSAALLRGDPNLALIMVDSWEADGAAYEGDSGDWHASLSAPSQEEFLRAAQGRVKFAGDRAAIWRLRSVAAAEKFPDEVADFVFLDADHSKEGCAADIAAWRPKVKSGGWLCGHDYENVEFPGFGVTVAVDEFVAREGLTLELGANFTWFVKMPGVPVQEEA